MMTIDLKFVELTADVLEFFFLKWNHEKKNGTRYAIHPCIIYHIICRVARGDADLYP